MANKGGVLTCSSQKIEVSLSSLLWFKSHGQQQEIREFWEKQGYCEAEPLPYECNQDGLIVTRNLEAFGFAVAGNADYAVYIIPF